MKEGELPIPFPTGSCMIRNTFLQPTVISERKTQGEKQDCVTALWKGAFTPSALYLLLLSRALHTLAPGDALPKGYFQKGRVSPF